MSTSAEWFDVGILGGGPAGATAAMVLARSGVGTLLVDEMCGMFKVGEGLPPGARPLLRSLGLWERLQADGHLVSCGNESAWGAPRLQSTHFLRDPNGHGWHLDRVRFDARLRDAAQEAGARVNVSARARHIVRAADTWSVTLDEGDNQRLVRTRWLIDCTGRRGWASRLSGARRVGVDHLVAFFSRYSRTGHHDADLDSMTLVESAPHGWWYTSRVPDGDRVVAYLTDAHDASARRARTRQGFSEILEDTQHVRPRLTRHGYTVDDPPRIVAADTSRLDRTAGDGWLAAGDAAMSFDPLSSQGILTAIYSGMAAAQAVASRLSGDRTAIEAYCGRLDAIYSTYLDRRREYYDQERRWPNHEFWRKRLAQS